MFVQKWVCHIRKIFDLLIFLSSLPSSFFISYWATFKSIHGGVQELSNIHYFIYYLYHSNGISFHNTIAVLEGLWGKKSEFVRTPKLNIEELKDKWKQNTYLSQLFQKHNFEGILILYFILQCIVLFYWMITAWLLCTWCFS
jgi:hypothetical protein